MLKDSVGMLSPRFSEKHDIDTGFANSSANSIQIWFGCSLPINTVRSFTQHSSLKISITQCINLDHNRKQKTVHGKYILKIKMPFSSNDCDFRF